MAKRKSVSPFLVFITKDSRNEQTLKSLIKSYNRLVPFLIKKMVQKRGLEPLQAYCPLDPEPSVSTNFTTSAHSMIRK